MFVFIFVIVVGVTGLCEIDMWSPSQGVFVTTVVREIQIHKTCDIVDEDPEWNDTFQLYASIDIRIININ